MKSIRFFLIITITATIVVFNFFAAIHGYRSSMQAAERLFDQQLADEARLIANFNANLLNFNLNESSNLAFQVWSADKVLKASSSNIPANTHIELTPGYSYKNFSSYRWRVFRYKNPHNNDWIIVAERADLRYILADNVVLKSISPIIIAIPFVAILIWVIVGKGLKPLQQLSNELKNKQPDDLKLLSDVETKSELQQLVESVNQLLMRVAQALDREKRFTSDAAHELRTPISVLKIQLFNLKKELQSEFDSEAIVQLDAGVNRIQHLVEQLLLLYRAQPQSLIERFEKLDLYLLCQQVIAENYEAIEEKKQNIVLNADNIYIKGNEFALKTLLKNLLSNANKYTPVGGSINIYVKQQKDKVVLQVEDSGIGISAEDRTKIFERFYRQTQQNIKETLPGCGLGLTIVKHIAEIHSAELTIASSQFKTGSLFSVIFDKVAS